MKNHKRLISMALALVMCLSLLTTAFASDTDEGYDVSNDIPWLNLSGPNEDLNDDDAILPLVTSFKDVKSSEWYYNDVMECAKLGIVSGFEDGTFRPEDNVTTIQFLVMLTRTFYNDTVEANKKNASGKDWYWPNTEAARTIGVSAGLAKIDESDMSRYDMALTLFNILTRNGKGYSAQHKTNLILHATDYSSISKTMYVNSVATCYYYGILTGHDDGSFGGTASMTRAQACTVIMRMLKLINNYNPGDKDNDVYDDGTSQNTNQSTSTRKLANGKDATVENVNAILAELKRMYPEGTVWGEPGIAGNHYYLAGNQSVDVRSAVCLYNAKGTNSKLNTQYACGGWAAMVSDAIFGQTGAPVRQVTKTTDLRPGDIYITMATATNTVSHVSIITSIEKSGSSYRVVTCDGNSDGGYVIWTGSKPGLEFSNVYNYYLAYTRYPA